ncbi:MAG: PKD domain-containing protein, partial [Candidatus Thermoplasmatota archaeon]|nr:PKD domain-containing protein [Candidatus Thermoplasmatota archaeon]
PMGIKVTDQDSESVNIYISSNINIEKLVYDELTGKWTNSLTTFVNFNIDFKIIVKNDGNNILNNVIVIDYLPTILVYNDNANLNPDSIIGNKIQWNIGTLNINQVVTIYFTTKATTVGYGNNIANTSGTICKTVYDQSEIPIYVLPCRNEVWIDDSWHGQSDVNSYNPNLIWGINAFNTIQRGVNVLCPCGTVHVLSGTYVEQILINKSLQMLGENEPLIILSPTAKSFTIHGSVESWVPIILAYGGILIGNDITGTGNIGVIIDGFKFDGRNCPHSVSILYHDVESNCVPAIISNNTITKVDIGIKIDGCSDDTTIIHNRITWAKGTIGKIGIIITSSGGCEPINVEIHYNYIGIPCSMNIGVWNQVSITVDAILNWWGEDDGPGNPSGGYTYDPNTGRIADGLGDDVIGLVHFDPWWGVDACANVHPLDVLLGDTVTFDASCSFANDENGAINPGDIEYMWNFDDGGYSFSKISQHIYNSPGTYNAVLRITVSNYYIEGVNELLISFTYFTVYVTQTATTLSANANSHNLKEYEGIINYPLQLYGSGQGGEPPFNYKWDLGDGSIVYENNPIHIYKDTKQYNPILTVTDKTGATAQDTAIVTIYKDKLTANAGGPYISNTGEEKLFQGQAYGGSEPYYYIWDFCNGRNIIQKQDPTYIFYKEGTYYAKLIVIDSKGNIDEDTIKVQIIKEESNAEIKEIKGGLGIKATIDAGEYNCHWDITVDGKVFLGGENNGTIDANTIETVKLGFSLAIGKVEITVTANEKHKYYTAFALGPLFLKIQET